MTRRRLLVLASAAQLAAGAAGMTIAIQRRRAYHFLFLRGSPDTVGRDSVLLGTALSAPMPMLVTQLVATVAVAQRRCDSLAATMLSALGAAMVPGYLGEAIVRERIRPGGWDRLESPTAVAGLALAAAMAGVAASFRAQERRSGPGPLPVPQPARVN